MFGHLFGKKGAGPVYDYDPAREKPVIRASICTGEQVAGFKDRETGHFREVALIRDGADMEAFLAACGVDHVDTEY